MARLLFHSLRLASLISLAAWIGVVVLWARSYRHIQCVAALIHTDAPYCVGIGVVQGGVECIVNAEDTITESVTIVDIPLAANQAPIRIPHLKYGFGCGNAGDGEFRARMPALVFALLLFCLSAVTWRGARRLQRRIITHPRV